MKSSNNRTSSYRRASLGPFVPNVTNCDERTKGRTGCWILGVGLLISVKSYFSVTIGKGREKEVVNISWMEEMTWETPKCYPMHYSILLTFTQMDWNTENTHISMQNTHANNAHHVLFEHTLLVLDIIWSETFFLLVNWVLGKNWK